MPEMRDFDPWHGDCPLAQHSWPRTSRLGASGQEEQPPDGLQAWPLQRTKDKEQNGILTHHWLDLESPLTGHREPGQPLSSLIPLQEPWSRGSHAGTRAHAEAVCTILKTMDSLARCTLTGREALGLEVCQGGLAPLTLPSAHSLSTP